MDKQNDMVNGHKFVECGDAEDYRYYIEGLKQSGYKIDALFLPSPGMIDFIDPVVIEEVGGDDGPGTVVSIGYTQKAGVRLYVDSDQAKVVEADFS